jgi:glutathione S-transferase
MSLTLHYHPLSSYCWKVLIGLYENATPFERVQVDFGDAESRAAFLALWPVGKMPVLQDAARNVAVPESTVILDYLDQFYPGPVRFTPRDPDEAWRTRLWDRFFDLYVQGPLQEVVGNRLRPADKKDPLAVAQAEARFASSYALLERELATRSFAASDVFGLADCAAMPALYYANKIVPFGDAHPRIAAYLARLQQRPSVIRVLQEAEPYAHFFPTA